MKKACVIGWPIQHSRSPVIHRHWLGLYGIDGAYDKVAVAPADLEVFIKSLRMNGFSGCNVTVPHKEQVLDLVDDASAAARAIGAANTLWFEDERLRATNTDAFGYMAYLQAVVPAWDKTSRSALVLGAGGAARAIIFGLLEAGVERVVVANRTLDRADALAAAFGAKVRVCAWERTADVGRDVSLVVNTTTLGMDGAGSLDFDMAVLRHDCIVSDIVYVPLDTPFLLAAKARGLRTVDGLGMLLHQAIPGFELWFGVRPVVTPELMSLVVRDLERH